MNIPACQHTMAAFHPDVQAAMNKALAAGVDWPTLITNIITFITTQGPNMLALIQMILNLVPKVPVTP